METQISPELLEIKKTAIIRQLATISALVPAEVFQRILWLQQHGKIQEIGIEESVFLKVIEFLLINPGVTASKAYDAIVKEISAETMDKEKISRTHWLRRRWALIPADVMLLFDMIAAAAHLATQSSRDQFEAKCQQEKKELVLQETAHLKLFVQQLQEQVKRTKNIATSAYKDLDVALKLYQNKLSTDNANVDTAISQLSDAVKDAVQALMEIKNSAHVTTT
jgi:hypothetical protein